MHEARQPFPCQPWCCGVGCDEHAGQAIVHRELPEPPVVSPFDREQLLEFTLEQHDDPHGIQPGEPFVAVEVGGTVFCADAATLGRIVEQANAARMRLLAARGEDVVPVVPTPRLRRRADGRSQR